MKLVHKETGVEVKAGDIVKNFRGEEMQIAGWQKPTSPASSGRVSVIEVGGKADPFGQSYYAGVYNCEWIEREDRD